MKKTLPILIMLVSIIAFSAAFTTNDPPGYKNLKILPQDISKEALDSIMHTYSHSLGVKCGFCHVHNEETKSWDMASDNKPEKQIARKMMLMADSINRKFFNPENYAASQQLTQTITCYTCHHGEPMPVSIPEVNVENKK